MKISNCQLTTNFFASRRRVRVFSLFIIARHHGNSEGALSMLAVATILNVR